MDTQRIKNTWMITGAAVLASTSLLPGIGLPVRAAASYPTAYQAFPDCASATDEFCIESMTFTPEGGAVQEIPSPGFDWVADGSPGDTAKVRVFLGKSMNGAVSYSGPNTPTADPWMPILNVEVIDKSRKIHHKENSDPVTLPGLDPGYYEVTIRTGDYDPGYMVLGGEYVKYNSSKGPDGNYTVTFGARPKPLLNSFNEARTTCENNKWMSPCEASEAWEHNLSAYFVMLTNPAKREASRGGWFATNAANIMVVTVANQFRITLSGPHYVPNDFPTTGLTEENGRYLNPAYFRIFLPYSGIADGYGSGVTAAMVKKFIQENSAFLKGSIEQANYVNGNWTVEEVQRSLTVTPAETGALIDFGLTHFSAPNPKVTVNKPDSHSIKKLANGATVSVVKVITRGSTTTLSNLAQASAGSSISKVTTSTKTVCQVKGKTLVAAKVGNCKVVVTVKKGKKSATYASTIRVS